MNQTNDAIIRSEEELEVHTRSRVVGRVRLHKRIVTETVQVTVEVQREELEIVREELDDEPYADAELASQSQTIVLSAQEPVVTLRVVPQELVHVHKELVSEREEIVAELRGERFELDETPPGAGS